MIKAPSICLLAALLALLTSAPSTRAASCQCPLSDSMGVCGDNGVTYPSMCYADCAGVQVVDANYPCPGDARPEHCVSARIKFRSIVPIQSQMAFLSDVEIENLGSSVASSSWTFSLGLNHLNNVNFITSSSAVNFGSSDMQGGLYVKDGPQLQKGDILSFTYQALAGDDILSDVFSRVEMNSIPCSMDPYPATLSSEVIATCCPEYSEDAAIKGNGNNDKMVSGHTMDGPTWMIYDGMLNDTFTDMSSDSQVHWSVHDPDAESPSQKAIHAVLHGGGCLSVKSDMLQRSMDTPVIAFRIRPSSIWPPLEVHIDNSMTNAGSEAINVASGAQGILHAGEWSTIMISNNFFRQDVKKWDTLSICNQDTETQQSFIANITVYTQEPSIEYTVDMDMPTQKDSCLVYTSSDTPVAVEDGLLAESIIVPAYISPELLRTMSMKVAINVNHPTVSHLEVSLRYESAIAWLARQKGGITPNFVGTIFSDYGETPIPMGLDAIAQTPFQGEYSLDPDSNSLEEFGEDVSLLMDVVDGMSNVEAPSFNLRVRDTVNDGMTATIQSWSLMLCEGPTSTLDDVFDAMSETDFAVLSTPTPGEMSSFSKPVECESSCISSIGFVGRSSRVLAREIAEYEADASTILGEKTKTHKAWIRLLPTSSNPFIVRLALEMMEDSGEYTTVRETNIMPLESELHTGHPDLHKLAWHQFQYSGKFRWSVEVIVGEGSYQSWVRVD